MAYETILYDVKDGIVRITINQAEKMNRLSNKVLHEVIQAVKSADEDESVRVVVISAAGEKAFCAGADLTSIAHDSAFPFTGSQNHPSQRSGAWPWREGAAWPCCRLLVLPLITRSSVSRKSMWACGR
jgi:enoyl-CoA hydratase/carnithine racemase